MTPLCECDFDPAYHRARNEFLGFDGAACGNPAADYGNVIVSPELCVECLRECAP